MTGKKLNPTTKAFVPGGPSTGNKDKDKSSSRSGGGATKASSAKPAAGAWGSKPLDAVKAAPSKPPSGGSGGSGGGNERGAIPPIHSTGRFQKVDINKNDRRGGDRGKQQVGNRNDRGNNNNNRDNNNRDNNNRRGGPNNRDNNNRDNNNRQHSNHPTMPLLDLCVPGQGKTDAQKAVSRIIASDLMAVRLQFLDAPEEEVFNPPDNCHWTSETRATEIQEAHQGPNVLGDVSAEKRRKPQPKETAPLLEDCKPLQVNEDTRWKSKAFDKNANAKEDDDSDDSDEEVLKKALLILNKLSLTKFDKLSDAFIDTGISRNVDCLNGAIELIVSKAQGEPHFSSMYAQLCSKLAKMPLEHITGLPEEKNTAPAKKKLFKKLLLTSCQHEFETDIAHKIAKANEGVEDKEEQAYHALLVKKNYLGHMRLIGELYHFDMIKIDIMLWCLKTLLSGDAEEEGDSSKNNKTEVDEEKVECFTKLIGTIGGSLEQQSLALKDVGKDKSFEKLEDCWRTVEIMAGLRKEKGPHVSNRIKFLLQDLIEMKNKGWVSRRKVETAQTIEQLHKDVAKEEKRAKRSTSSNNLGGRRSSAPDIRMFNKQNQINQERKQVDNDGFTQVSTKVGRSVSAASLNRSKADMYTGEKRSSSSKSKRFTSSENLSVKAEKKQHADKKEEKQEEAPALTPEYLSANECGDKAKKLLKEFFVGGDLDDAVLSFHELLGAGKSGSVERCAKALEQGVMMVMEMKEADVTKMLTVLSKCVTEGKWDKASIPLGLNDPLEFLGDIEIDAPLAGVHLASIIAELMKLEALSFDFLLNAPEYFRTDGNSAQFGCKIIKKVGGDVVDEHVEVIEKLMTDNDKVAHATARDLLAA